MIADAMQVRKRRMNLLPFSQGPHGQWGHWQQRRYHHRPRQIGNLSISRQNRQLRHNRHDRPGRQRRGKLHRMCGMDAVILAAGLGTRLRPHTLHTPKPMLPVQGRPILDWMLAALPVEIDRLLVVVHYLAEQVEAYLRSQTRFKEWLTVLQDQPRGTGDALRRCREHIRCERLLVINGDDLYGVSDLAALARCSAGLLVHAVDEPRRYGIA